MLRVTSTYIRDDSRFCEIIPLEDTPHGSLVQRELSAQLTEGLSSYHCIDISANTFKILTHFMIRNPNNIQPVSVQKRSPFCIFLALIRFIMLRTI